MIQLKSVPLISSGLSASGLGNGGEIQIKTPSLRIDNGFLISTSSLGQGNAGDVTIQASDWVSVQDGASLQAFTSGRGQAGNVTIAGRNGSVPRVRFEGMGLNGASAIVTFVGSEAGGTGTGSGGDITIQAKSLFLSDDATFTARSFAQGPNQNAGNIVVTVEDDFIGLNGARLRTSTSGPGNAGDIRIRAGDQVLLEGRGDPRIPSTFIESAVETTSRGKGGDISIEADQISLLNGAVISTASSSLVATDSQADAGDLSLKADQNILVRDGSRLTSFSFGRGNAGNINLTANGDVSFAGDFTGISSGSALQSSGVGGNINIQAESFSLSRGAFLETATLSEAEPNTPLNAGDISIQVDQDVAIGPGAALRSFSNRYGDAGDITILAKGRVSFDGVDPASNLETGASSFVGFDGRGQGGTIRINAASLFLANGVDFSAFTFGQAGSNGQLSDAGNIEIQVDESVNIQNGSELLSNTGGQGNAGHINIQAGQSVRIDSSSELSSFSNGQGDAGGINIRANNGVFIDRDSTLSSSVGSRSTGQGGDIEINTNVFELTNGANLFTSTIGQALLGERNNAGNIDIQAQESVLISQGAELVSSTFGQGDAGNVTIQSEGVVSLDGNDGLAFDTGIFSTVGLDGVGTGGEINVQAGAIAIRNASTINAETFGRGDAGRISLESGDAIQIQNSRVVTNSEGIGSPGKIDIQTQSLFLTERGTIGSNILPPQSPNPFIEGSNQRLPLQKGDITINATDTVDISGFSTETGVPSGLFARTSQGAMGPAGNIQVTTDAFRISDGGAVDATTSNPSPGGQITIRANNLSALEGGQIFTSTSNSGNAGTIQLNIKDTLTLSGRDSTYLERRDRFGQDAIRIQAPESGIYANTTSDSTGNGGMINVQNAQTLNLETRAVLTSQSEGTGDAGRITINIPGLIDNNNGTISTRAIQGAGGGIDIQAADLRLRGDSDIRTDVFRGDGGNILIRANSIIAFDDSDILTFARSGDGGDIRLVTAAYFGNNFQSSNAETNLDRLDGNNRADINASGSLSSGLILQPDNSFVESSLVELSDTLVDTNQLISNSCVAPSKVQGSFILSGPDSLPNRPNDTPVPTFPTGTIRALPTEQSNRHQQPWQMGDAIEEPQNVYRLTNGKLILGKSCDN